MSDIPAPTSMRLVFQHNNAEAKFVHGTRVTLSSREDMITMSIAVPEKEGGELKEARFTTRGITVPELSFIGFKDISELPMLLVLSCTTGLGFWEMPRASDNIRIFEFVRIQL